MNTELLLEIVVTFHLGRSYLQGGKGDGVSLAYTEQWPSQHWASAWPNWEELTGIQGLRSPVAPGCPCWMVQVEWARCRKARAFGDTGTWK